MPDAVSLVDLFAAQAARGPDRIAVRFGPATLTYGDLDAASRTLATALRERLPPGALVGVFLERSPRLLVTLLGILRAGAAYLPLDPAFPDERLAYMLTDCAAALTLTEPSLHDRLRAVARRAAGPVLALDCSELRPLAAPVAVPSLHPRDLAYVLYTSGSTGRPKGVEIEHGSLTNVLQSFRRRPGLGPDDVLLAVTTISFDIAALELFLPLICGACVAIAPASTARDGTLLRELVGASGATTMQATPSTWRMLFAAGWEGDRKLTAWCGGEALPLALAGELRARCRAVWNLYGPTETTIWSSVHPVGGGDTGATAGIGRPIDATTFRVLDPQLEPVAPGVAGELYIGGAGLARGYHRQPALTAGRFVADRAARGRLYRTGDIVRQAADGSVQFLGRADQQVKIRGFRLEIGEIEAALDRLPCVAQSVVVASPTGNGERRLVAYVRGTAAAADAEALRAALLERLPAYMIPSAFVTVEEFPMTPNGKVDRQALPAPAPERSPSRAPRTDDERVLCAVIAELLHLDDVGIDDDFFALGGDSISSMQLIGRARDAGLVLTQNDVFAHPTAAGLAAVAVRRVDEPGRAFAPAAATGAEILPLAPLQHELLALTRGADAPDAFRVQLAVELEGTIDAERLHAAIEAVVDRYPNLRAVFLPDGTGQIFSPAAVVPWRVVDVQTADAATSDACRAELAAEEHRTPVAPGTARLRFLLLRLGERRHELVFTFDHAVLDGWSIPILFEELFALYADPSRSLSPVRPYAEYLRWIAGLDREAARVSWRNTLAGSDGPTLVAPHAPAGTPRRSAFVEAVLSTEGTAALQRLARERSVTLNAVLQALWARELARLTGRTDVVFGVTVAGRPPELPDTDRMVGLFTNTLPVRVRIGTATTLDDTIDAIVAGQPAILAGQYVGLSEIDGATGAFDTLFVFQNYPGRGPLSLPDGLRIAAVRGQGEETHFALNLMIVPGERLRLRFDYDAGRLERGQVDAILDGLVQRAESAGAPNDAPVPAGDTETNPFERDDATYVVLVNDEERYSLWPAELDVPPGWTIVGPRGDRQTCLDWIEATWVDMRPRSVRVDA